MIVENHQIAYRNVASKKYNFFPEEIEIAVQDFVQLLSKYNYSPTGVVFYSVIGESVDGVMTAELFIQINETYLVIPAEETVKFTSYFSVENLLMTRVKDNFDVNSQEKYRELFSYMEQKKYTQKTPLFVEIKKAHTTGSSYVELSMGVL